MTYPLALLVVLLSMLFVCLLVLAQAWWAQRRRPTVFRPEVGGVWQSNRDWNIRSRS